MLYIFFVNTGTMWTFDMSLAIETVENLKWAICEKHHIPVESQVLLISGGVSLNPNLRVCDYSSAGTDTSPIYLFRKNQMDLPMDVSYSNAAVYDSCDDMKDRVESCLQMEPNFNTVVARNEMAIQLHETDRSLFNTCENLVHDQHLQQQSWAAVMANHEDIIQSFENKAKKLGNLYEDILLNKSAHQCLLENFEKDKQILSKIPVLKCLLGKTESQEEELSMLDWVMKKDNKSLDELYCWDELNEYDHDKLFNIRNSVESTLKECNNFDMKEIKGLEQRLSALEKLINDAKSIYEKQNILCKGFNQNQTRISGIRDPSILPDLCQNHREQMQSMLENHHQLVELKNKCQYAKRELSTNLNQRLRWIIHVQENLIMVDHSLVVVGIKLQKLRKKIKIIQSLHTCPQIYLESILEVFRRRNFTDTFFDWAQKMARISRRMVDEELSLRECFSEQLDNHFLKYFFPGMNDRPVNFINEPIQIDQALPHISLEDIDLLREALPDMFEQVVVPCSVPVPSIDVSKEKQPKAMDRNVCQKDATTATILSLADVDNLDSIRIQHEQFRQEKNEIIEQLSGQINQHRVDDEKKSKLLLQLRTNCADLVSFYRSLRDDAFAHQDESVRLRNMFERLQKEIQNLHDSSLRNQSTILVLNDEIELLRARLRDNSDKLEDSYVQLTEEKQRNVEKSRMIEKLTTKLENYEQLTQKQNSLAEELRKLFQILNQDLSAFQTEMNSLMTKLKDDEWIGLRSKIESHMQKHRENYEQELNSVRKEIFADKERQIQELREKLNFDHRSELESLKHRFKLAISTTSIERTASETSLEKVQLDIVDQSAQEKEIQKLKSLLNEQKQDYEQQIGKLKSETEKERKLIMVAEGSRKKASTENELQTDFLKQKINLYENILTRINNRISNDDGKDPESMAAMLRKELNDFDKSLELLNSCSFISIPPTPDSPTKNLGINLDDVNIDLNIEEKITANSCEIGDVVLVYFEKRFENFIVFSSNDSLNYIHSDSLKECDITKSASNEYDWIIAKVTQKEYCQIKKEENRYKLPVNTKFHRVKIQKINKCPPVNLDRLKELAKNNRSMVQSSSGGNLISNWVSMFTSSTAATNSSSAEQKTAAKAK